VCVCVHVYVCVCMCVCVDCLPAISNTHSLFVYSGRIILLCRINPQVMRQDTSGSINLHASPTPQTPISMCATHNCVAISGQGGINFLYLDASSAALHNSGKKPQVKLLSKTAALGDYSSAEFSQLAMGGEGKLDGYCFALTKQGVLCVLRRGGGDTQSLPVAAAASQASWEIEKWVDLRLGHGAGLSLHTDVIVIGGKEGKVRLFEPTNLHHLATLPKPQLPPFLGMGCPDIAQLRLSGDAKTLVCLYADHNIVFWELDGIWAKPKPSMDGSTRFALHLCVCVRPASIMFGSIFCNSTLLYTTLPFSPHYSKLLHCTSLNFYAFHYTPAARRARRCVWATHLPATTAASGT
jgi:hypothetical protein